MIKCKNCGVYFEPKKPHAEYCSEKCNKKAKYKRRIEQGLCYRCGKKVEDINPRTGKPFNRCRYHREKHKVVNNRHYLNTIEQQRYKNKKRADYQRQWRKKRAEKAKQKLLGMYGNKCACCGESKCEFLTLDHINGDGHDHRMEVSRSSYRIHEDACKEYRPDLFRILCMNCNWAYGQYGRCPHQNDC